MKKKGFTLIEVLVASAIFFILIQAVYDFYIHNAAIMDQEKKKAQIDMVSQSIMDQISQSLKISYRYDSGKSLIKVKEGGGGISMVVPKGNTSPYYDPANALNLSFTEDTSSRSLVIKRSDISGSQTILEGHVDDFSVTDENGCYKVLLKINYGFADMTRDFVVYYYPREVDK